MTATAQIFPFPKAGTEPKLSADDNAILIRQMRRYDAMADEGRPQRNATDRKGAKFYRSQMWEEGITENRLAITSNLGVALYERMTSTITRNEPVPMVEPLNANDDSAASLVQGGLLTVWRHNKMTQQVKVGQRLCGFTHPICHYIYWDFDAIGPMGSTGFITSRKIPAHRCDMDDRHQFVKDMEFAGFTEEMTRAKLVQLFPNKRREIHKLIRASESEAGKTKAETDPLREDHVVGSRVQNRVVQSFGSSQFVGVQSIRYGRDNVDKLSEVVKVKFRWFRDPHPVERQKPKKDPHGNVVHELVRDDETGKIQFEVGKPKVVDGPFGPMYVPDIKPKRRVVMETVIEKKFKQWRHVVWVPEDDLILWDVAWNGPVPLVTQRDSYSLNGYWSDGTALRLASLGVARNVLLSIIFQRLRLSLAGTFLASNQSGLKRNKLVPQEGTVFYAARVDESNIRYFPTQPLDAAYFNLLGNIKSEMSDLLGLSEPMQGQAAGRADSPATYDRLIEQGGVSIIDRAQLLEDFISDWCYVVMWFMQTMFTHEHYVEVENAEGGRYWMQASALTMRGKFAVNIESGSTISYSEAAQYERAKDLMSIGVYTLPMFVRVAHVPHGSRALREKGDLIASGKTWLLGPSAAPPATQNKAAAQPPKRSHHAPGR